MIKVWNRRNARTLGGVLAALVLVELGLRPFGTGLRNQWQEVPIVNDRDAPRVEVRSYHEGIAVSHFSSAHARLTGAPPIPSAPVVVILGDSYVEAKQVGDEETVGAVLERRARNAGVPLNIRQYGWAGAGVPQYLGIAPDILQRWHPASVVVLLNDQDLVTPEAKTADGGAIAVPAAAEVSGTRAAAAAAVERKSHPLQALTHALTASSVLFYEVTLRALALRGGDAVDGAGVAAAPSAGTAHEVQLRVAALRHAFGTKLLLLHVPTLRPDGLSADSLGVYVEVACRETRSRCVSAADAMRHAQLSAGQFPRGFNNSEPGLGHPNALGHAAIAEALWQVLFPAPNRGEPLSRALP